MISMDRHFFKIENEWNVIHLPERPNGFAIVIVGDKNHYVDDSTSLWIQNPDRFQMIEQIREAGYTIFYSNLFGRHWGSPKAVQLLKRLYHMIIRNHILNEKIHVIAEGMGALASLKLINEMEPSIRSLSLLSPCIDLKGFIETEKNNKLFYKRFIKELSNAYVIDEKLVEEKIVQNFDVCSFTAKVPIKIWHATDRASYSITTHSRLFEKIRKKQNAPISLSMHLYEKRFEIVSSIINYLKSNEHIL